MLMCSMFSSINCLLKLLNVHSKFFISHYYVNKGLLVKTYGYLTLGALRHWEPYINFLISMREMFARFV